MECCKRTYINVMHSSYVVLLSCRTLAIVINCTHSTGARISTSLKQTSCREELNYVDTSIKSVVNEAKTKIQ